MELQVNFKIVDLEGKSIGQTANVFMANILLAHKGEALKLYELALKINAEESIEVDTTDLNLIETAIKENEQFNNLIKGALLKEIERQKTISNKEK